MVLLLGKITEQGLLIVFIYSMGSVVSFIGVIKHVYQDTQPREFGATLFTIVKTWKPLKYPLMRDGLVMVFRSIDGKNSVFLQWTITE